MAVKSIPEIIRAEKPSLSMEVFPPKNDSNYEKIQAAAEEIAALKPDFMSVTYGAGGGTSVYTAEIAQLIQDKYDVPALAHITCVSSANVDIHGVLSNLRERGIGNVLALRGDIPEGFDFGAAKYAHASDLVSEIKAGGEFFIGGACYPEAHPESASYKEDMAWLKVKEEAGCEFFTTQMFFDNDIFYNFMFRAREAGITIPVVAGIMPITNASQIKRIMSINQTALPQRFVRIVDRYGDNPEAMKQAGIAYATEQIIDLYANGIGAVHVYSMNHPDVARKIMENVSSIVR